MGEARQSWIMAFMWALVAVATIVSVVGVISMWWAAFAFVFAAGFTIGVDLICGGSSDE